MSDTPNLEVIPLPVSTETVAPVQIAVTEVEAEQILQELGLIECESRPKLKDDAEKKKVSFDIRKSLRLGAFVEENSVRLDSGKVLVADQILVTQLMRLNQQAEKLTSPKELAEISYPMGYIADKIKKTSKTKVVIEVPQRGAGRTTQPSWVPGERVLPEKVG